MPCKCTSNTLNNKKLYLEDMKNMPIDDIVRLYQEGYKIESMQTYDQVCTNGTQTVDINWSSVSQQGGRYLYKESAKAIKINPSSRCLDSISFYGVRRITNVNIYVEIRQDDGTGNKPLGNPGTSTGQLIQVSVPYGNIPTTFGSSFTVDFALLLPSVGTYWVVLRSSDYSCANAATQRLELSYHYLNENRYIIYGYSDLYCSPAGCCWYGLNVDPIPLSTIKRTYNPPVLTTIQVSPITVQIPPGGTQQLTATCKDQNNNTMTCPTLTWGSTNNSVAIVNSSGLITGVSAGTTIITASASGVTSNISTVTIVPILSSITIDPSSKTLSPGGTQQFSATCKDQNNNTMTCPTLTWSINPSLGTVSNTGLFTAGSTPGTATIRATSGSIYGTASVTITTTTPVLTTITIMPSTAYVAPGNTKTFTAMPKDQFGGVISGVTITWNVMDTTKGTLAPTTGLSTLFTGAAEGTTTIRAISGSIIGNATVTVTTTPPSAGIGTGIIIIGVAALAGLALIMRK